MKWTKRLPQSRGTQSLDRTHTYIKIKKINKFFRLHQELTWPQLYHIRGVCKINIVIQKKKFGCMNSLDWLKCVTVLLCGCGCDCGCDQLLCMQDWWILIYVFIMIFIFLMKRLMVIREWWLLYVRGTQEDKVRPSGNTPT